MKTTTFLGIVAPFVATVDGHVLFTTLYIDDVKQGDGTCVRETDNTFQPTNPVIDFNSNDIVCGFGGLKPVAFTCPASAGAKLSFEYRKIADTAGSGPIDENHKGPCAVYAKQLASPDDSAAGAGWVKIWDEGFDAATGKWCTEKTRDTDGFFSIDIPESFPAGNYLIRPELTAMHNVTPQVEPQFYTGCAQVFIESSVTGSLDPGPGYSVSIPGYITVGEPSVTHNIYTDDNAAYVPPGPKAYNPAVSLPTTDSVTKQSTGGVPANCLLKNGNWCGVEVPAYSDAAGCDAAAENCWAQTDACYNTTQPSGNKNCPVWEEKCKELNNQCGAGNVNGPPKFDLKNAESPAPDSLPPAWNAGSGASSAASESASQTEATLPDTSATAAPEAAAVVTITYSALAPLETVAPANPVELPPSTLATVVDDSTSVGSGRGRFANFGAKAVAHTETSAAAGTKSTPCSKNKRRSHRHGDPARR